MLLVLLGSSTLKKMKLDVFLLMTSYVRDQT